MILESVFGDRVLVSGFSDDVALSRKPKKLELFGVESRDEG